MTSSPNTVIPSILTHLPTIDFHPIIQLSNHECDLITASRNMVHRLTQTPESIKLIYRLQIFQKYIPSSKITPGPIVTLGPI